jgi:hypothetical protein
MNICPSRNVEARTTTCRPCDECPSDLMKESGTYSYFQIYHNEDLLTSENTLQHTATHCNTLQHTVTQNETSSLPQSRPPDFETLFFPIFFARKPDSLKSLMHALQQCRQHTATHCNTLQHTATHCNTLQHTVTAPPTFVTHYNTLQRTETHATPCDTVQQCIQHPSYTTTHCNTL